MRWRMRCRRRRRRRRRSRRRREREELTTIKRTTRVDWLPGVDGWWWERSKGLQCPSFA
jgi:hypothetical protein